MVFQRLRNLLETGIGGVSEKTGGIGVGLPFRRVQSFLDPLVKTVRHPVPGKFPVVSERNISTAINTKVFFMDTEFPPTGDTGSREEKVEKR